MSTTIVTTRGAKGLAAAEQLFLGRKIEAATIAAMDAYLRAPALDAAEAVEATRVATEETRVATEQTRAAAQSVVDASDEIVGALPAARDARDSAVEAAQLAVDAVAPVQASVTTFVPRAADSSQRGLLSLIATNPVKPWLKTLVARFSDEDGAFEISKIRLFRNSQTGSRWLAVFRTNAGKLLLGFDFSGRARLLLDDKSIAYVQARLTGVGGISDRSLPAVGLNGGASFMGRSVDGGAAFLSDGNLGRVLSYTRRALTGQVMATSSKRAMIQTGGGQSNEEGRSNATTDGIEAVSRYPELLFTLADGRGAHGPGANTRGGVPTFALGDAREFAPSSSQNGDTGYLSGASWLLEALTRAGRGVRPIAMRSHGASGQEMSTIKPGGTGPQWQNGLYEVQNIVNEFAKFGLTSFHAFERFIHGEANTAIGSSYAYYLGELQNYVTQLQVQYKPLTGQPEDVKMILVQIAPWYNNGAATLYPVGPVGQAMLDFCIAEPNAFIAAPGHIFERLDGIHFTNMARRHLGEYVNKAWFRWESTGVKPEPCRVLSATYSNDGGPHIDLLCNVPVGSLRVLDTSNGGWLAPHPTCGILAGDDAGAAAITSVTIVGGNTIRVALAAAPGANRWISTSYGETVTYAAPGYPYPRGGGTIFDQDDAPSRVFPTRGLPNALCSTRINY